MKIYLDNKLVENIALEALLKRDERRFNFTFTENIGNAYESTKKFLLKLFFIIFSYAFFSMQNLFQGFFNTANFWNLPKF